jgi:glucose/arabinose dehydrogenase
MRFLPDGSNSTFATGFAAPIDVTAGPDGALYVADYATGIIFKIDYTG